MTHTDPLQRARELTRRLEELRPSEERELQVLASVLVETVRVQREALQQIIADFEATEINREATGESRNYVAERLAGYAYDVAAAVGVSGEPTPEETSR